MNIADEILINIDHLTAADIIEIAAGRWQSEDHGITEEMALSYPQFMRDLLHIIDFDAVCNWNGLEYYVRNCDKAGFEETVRAFDNIKAENESGILAGILNMPDIRRLHNNEIKKLPKETVKAIEEKEARLYLNNDDSPMWELLEKYLAEQAAIYSRKG